MAGNFYQSLKWKVARNLLLLLANYSLSSGTAGKYKYYAYLIIIKIKSVMYNKHLCKTDGYTKCTFLLMTRFNLLTAVYMCRVRQGRRSIERRVLIGREKYCFNLRWISFLTESLLTKTWVHVERAGDKKTLDLLLSQFGTGYTFAISTLSLCINGSKKTSEDTSRNSPGKHMSVP